MDSKSPDEQIPPPMMDLEDELDEEFGAAQGDFAGEEAGVALPFEPERLKVMANRFDEALSPVYDLLDNEDHPATKPEHVFDCVDGLRLVVCVEEYDPMEDSNVGVNPKAPDLTQRLLHVMAVPASPDWEPPSHPRVLFKSIQKRMNVLRGFLHMPNERWVAQNGVAHLTYPYEWA